MVVGALLDVLRRSTWIYRRLLTSSIWIMALMIWPKRSADISGGNYDSPLCVAGTMSWKHPSLSFVQNNIHLCVFQFAA